MMMPALMVGEATVRPPWSEGEPIRGGRDPETGSCWIEIERVGWFEFRPGAGRVHARPFPGTSAATLHAAWIATVLPLALQAAGHHLLHASAALTEHGVVAFCGRSGAGKSTLARALARRSHRQWADDAVRFEIEGARVTTSRLPFLPRLRPDAAAKLGGPPPPEDTASEEPAEAPLLAVYLLHRSRAATEPTLEPLDLKEAFPALLDNAYRFAADDTLGGLAETYLDLATRVPVARLTLPDGLDRLVAAIDTHPILRRAAAPSA